MDSGLYCMYSPKTLELLMSEGLCAGDGIFFLLFGHNLKNLPVFLQQSSFHLSAIKLHHLILVRGGVALLLRALFFYSWCDPTSFL